jgi:vacuolar-type H+-ATPase subunit H
MLSIFSSAPIPSSTVTAPSLLTVPSASASVLPSAPSAPEIPSSAQSQSLLTGPSPTSVPSAATLATPPTSAPTINTQGLLSFNGATHAERNLAGDGLIQPSRSLTKLTDAQKATRKIRQETERRAQELLSKDLDQLLTKQREELEELAGQHGKKVEAIDKLISTSGHYKHKRSVNIENAKVHMKSQEVNAGKSSHLILIF